MYIIAIPFFLKFSITLKRFSVSTSVKAVVGSSIIIILAFLVKAFAISIICFSPTLRVLTSLSGSISQPICSKNILLLSSNNFLFILPVNLLCFSLPKNIFSETVKLFKTLSSW